MAFRPDRRRRKSVLRVIGLILFFIGLIDLIYVLPGWLWHAFGGLLMTALGLYLLFLSLFS